MARITYISLAGKTYPMSFSLMASKKLAQKFGSVAKALASMSKKNMDVEAFDTISYILSLLISQGCAYKNYFEKDVPVPNDAPIIDGAWAPIPQEAIEVCIQLSEMGYIAEKIEECVSGGEEKEVEAHSKNQETRQE